MGTKVPILRRQNKAAEELICVGKDTTTNLIFSKTPVCSLPTRRFLRAVRGAVQGRLESPDFGKRRDDVEKL